MMIYAEAILKNPKMDKKKAEFKMTAPMVTDIMERKDRLSKQLLEYFEKNFDVKLSKVREKYSKERL